MGGDYGDGFFGVGVHVRSPRTLEKQIGVERKSIVAMRNVLRDNLNYLWETKAELHTQLWNFREKTDKLQENIDVCDVLCH